MSARVEQSSAEAQIVSVKTEEGQALKNSYKGVAAILQFGSQESLNRASLARVWGCYFRIVSNRFSISFFVRVFVSFEVNLLMLIFLRLLLDAR
jgi:hypothetical protein